MIFLALTEDQVLSKNENSYDNTLREVSSLINVFKFYLNIFRTLSNKIRTMCQ